MLASYELYLENHLPSESYEDWIKRIGAADVNRINAEDAQVQHILRRGYYPKAEYDALESLDESARMKRLQELDRVSFRLMSLP